MIFPAKSVGIDIGSDSVNVAVAVLKGGHVKIQNLITEEIPDAPEHEKKAVIASIIKRIYSENGLKGDKCVACLPASLSINRMVTMPLTDTAKIRQTLKFQIEPLIPYPVDQVICDSVITRGLGDSTEVLAVAVSKEPISARLQVMEMAEVSPDVLTLDALCLADFFVNPLDFSSDKVTALVLVGFENSFLGFFVGEKLIGYRNLHGMSAGDEGAANKLVRDIQRSIMGFQPSSGEINEVGALCIAGQVSETLRGMLQESFREFPVRIVEYNEGELVEIPPEFQNAADDCKLAVALAYSGLRPSNNSINLRQEEFSPPSLVQQIKPRIMLSAALLVALALAWFCNVRVQIHNQSKELKALNKEMLEIFADTLPGLKSPSAVESKIKEEQEKFKSLRNYSSSYVSPLEIMSEVAKSVPAGKNLVLGEMHISEDFLRLKGTVESFDDIDAFKKRIEDSPMLSSVKIESASKAEKGEQVNFRIRAQIGREPVTSADTQSGGDS